MVKVCTLAKAKCLFNQEKRSCDKIINDQLNISDFTLDQGESHLLHRLELFETYFYMFVGSKCYLYDCRCGGKFVIEPEDGGDQALGKETTTTTTEENNSSSDSNLQIVIDCNSCSLSVSVTGR